MEPGDKVLIPCPKRKRNIRFEGSEQNEKLVLRAEVLEASEFSITVRFLDYGAVQEYNPAHTDIYFPDQEFFDDKKYPMFAIRYDKMIFKGKWIWDCIFSSKHHKINQNIQPFEENGFVTVVDRNKIVVFLFLL